MINSIGGRKVLATLIILAIGCGAVALKGDIPPGLLEMLNWCFTAYVTGNVLSHVAKAVVARAEAQASTSSVETPAVDLSSIEAGLVSLNAELSEIKADSALTKNGVQSLLQYVVQATQPRA